jgi:hypothetical protein
MKKVSIIFFALIFTGALFAQNVGINSTGATPSSAAMLDISSTDKGLLIPRVALTALNVASPISTTTLSLLIFNTASASSGSTAVSPGYYYWDGVSSWVAFSGNGSKNWSLTGSAGTTSPATPVTYGTSTITSTENYIGTTDAKDIVFGTNSIERMRIKLSTGLVGIGTAAPAQLFDISNKFQVNSTGNLVKVNNIAYSWPASQGAATTVLQNDGSGNLSWADYYGSNVQYTEGTTDISTSSSTYADMAGMSITFTPKHTTVYIHVTASGDINLSATRMGYVKCRVTNSAGTVVYGKVVSMATDYDDTQGNNAAWNCSIVCRVTGLTVGASTTLKTQWAHGGTNPGTARCNAAAGTDDYSSRAMMIFD